MQANIRTEQEYRAIPMDSSSSLKVFSEDRRKYWKKYVQNDSIEEEDKDSKAIILGKLVETLLFEPDQFDNRFHLSSVHSLPTGNMLAFVEALFKHTVENRGEDGECTLHFQELASLAYQESGYKRDKLETVLSKFIGKDPELYYQELLNVRTKGLLVVGIDEVTGAEKTVEGLKNSPFTGPIVNMVTSDRYEVLKQLQIEGYKIDGLPMKSMIDLVIIDHKFKTISIYDLKTVWSVEGFYRDYFLYRRAYIQAYVYYKAVEYYKDNMGYSDYHVQFPQFIVCDSINYYQPLIYKTDSDVLEDAYNGFTFENRQYPGVQNIIEDLKWAKTNDQWTISRSNYENSGIVLINV